MLVKQSIYILYLFIFIFSIFILIHSIKNKNRIISRHIIVLSITYILYLIFNIVLPFVLDLDIGFEMLLCYGSSVLSTALFIISIIVAIIKLKKQQTTDKLRKYKIIFAFCLLFPIFILGFSYFREINYINNSKLILVCSEGDGFNEVDYAYAISDNYSEKITIGADFRGMDMDEHLPSHFRKLNYTWTTDKIEINEDKIIIFRNNKIIYKINTTNSISYCDIEEVFYKQP